MNKIYEKLIELEEASRVDYEISYRGGHYGLKVGDVLELLNIPDKYDDYFPGKVGVYCNYLGGGLRGSIVGGGYNKELPKTYAEKVQNFYASCRQRYLDIENGLNDEIDENGETNWDAVGTNANRAVGIESAY